MMTAFRWFGTALFTCALAAAVAAQAPRLDVRFGLWEITTSTSIQGKVPGMDQPGATPEQQAQMEAAMKAMTAPRTDVAKACWTKADLESGEFVKSDVSGDPECKKTITQDTKNALGMVIECTGDAASKGTVTIEAPSPTTVKAVMNSSGSQGGQSMTVNLVMTAKWLAATCGSVQ